MKGDGLFITQALKREIRIMSLMRDALVLRKANYLIIMYQAGGFLI